jgi:hypothetical protein
MLGSDTHTRQLLARERQQQLRRAAGAGRIEAPPARARRLRARLASRRLRAA